MAGLTGQTAGLRVGAHAGLAHGRNQTAPGTVTWSWWFDNVERAGPGRDAAGHRYQVSGHPTRPGRPDYFTLIIFSCTISSSSMPTSLVEELKVGPTTLLGQARKKFQRATS